VFIKIDRHLCYCVSSRVDEKQRWFISSVAETESHVTVTNKETLNNQANSWLEENSTRSVSYKNRKLPVFYVSAGLRHSSLFIVLNYLVPRRYFGWKT
jgi:hypothetical protein